jgi:type IV/VI secretion system ImpK/VasF family protein
MRSSSNASIPPSARAGSPPAGIELKYLQWFRTFVAQTDDFCRAVQQRMPIDPLVVKRTLLTTLANQREAARKRIPEHQLGEFHSAQYIMVAVADELLLKAGWEVQETWSKYLLEEEPPFGSHAAGDRVFNDLDDILFGRKHASVELLTVYGTALALGFRGRFAHASKAANLTNYRQRIAQRVAQATTSNTTGDLCPLATERPWDRVPRQVLPSRLHAARPFLYCIWAFICILGPGIWWLQVAEVREHVESIEEKSQLPARQQAHSED